MEDIGREGRAWGKKELIMKTWERCKSLGGFRRKKASLFGMVMTKSKSWSHGLRMERSAGAGKRDRAAPQGWLWVCVGEEKQRFLIKTEHVNHPLFGELLEEAELEYGYRSDGPLIFPCEVDHFLEVLREMESTYDDNKINDNDNDNSGRGHGCSFRRNRNHASYHLFTPPRQTPSHQVV